MDKNDHTAPQTLVSTPTKQLPHTCTQGWRSVNNNLFLFLKHKHQSLNSIFCLTNASKTHSMLMIPKHQWMLFLFLENDNKWSSKLLSITPSIIQWIISALFPFKDFKQLIKWTYSKGKDWCPHNVPNGLALCQLYTVRSVRWS